MFITGFSPVQEVTMKQYRVAVV
ncbi:NADPH-dependent FMN reductase, partial [Salmonella enterica subsp. enterica serovar Bareilly]|nr:NADPH-dependent FMN reductase [Salmonella enterica subsp. enterica serovar Bareilly]